MINDELKDIVIWLRANRLSLIISKTHYMLFSNKKVIPANVTIEINGQPITWVSKTKFLGVIIDNKLTWKEYISYISGKVAKGIGIISKVRKYLNKNTLLDLYYSFIYPYLTYCNQVWGLIYECLGEVTKKSYHNYFRCSPKNTYWSIVHRT